MEGKEKNLFQINLSIPERVVCLQDILSKVKKLLYVYDKSREENSTYNYKQYCDGIIIYVSSSNTLFNGELVSILVNLYSIRTNDFNKSQIKRIVFETINNIEYMLEKYRGEK